MVEYLLPSEARKAGEKLLAEHVSEDPFAAAFKATRMPMIITDPNQEDNPIIFCNRAFNELTGYSNEDLIGQNCRLLQGDKTDRNTIGKIRDAVETGRSVSVDILNYRKDGSEFWNALFVSPVRNAEGKVIYFFASQLDFTQIKTKESELAAARQQAEEEVLNRTKDLREALEAQTLLVHEVDHRVKNNLMTIASIVKLQDRMTQNDTVSATLKSVLNRIEALSTVHRKLFTFENLSRFDVADFAEDLVVNLTGQLRRSDINVTLDLSPVFVPAAKASPLSLIINELVGDAVRRGLGDGGGDIHVTVKRLNGHFLVRVVDTIDPVEVDEEEHKFSQLLLETCARQVNADIRREKDGKRTTVSVTLMVENEKDE